jgi:hypothetical protein
MHAAHLERQNFPLSEDSSTWAVTTAAAALHPGVDMTAHLGVVAQPASRQREPAFCFEGCLSM